jgi:hypothetical protein
VLNVNHVSVGIPAASDRCDAIDVSAPGAARASPTGEFPPRLSDLHPSRARSIRGTTAPRLYADSAGELYVGKPGRSPAHAAAEVSADLTYRAVDPAIAPESALVTIDGIPVRLTRWVEGIELNEIRDQGQLEAGLAATSRHFAVDALLANRDIPSAGKNPLTNVKITPQGAAVRVDNGSALRFRGYFGMKPDFDECPLDLWTLRDPRFNKWAARAFSRLSWSEITEQVARVCSRRAAILEVTLPADLVVMAGRLGVYRFLVDATGALIRHGVPQAQVDPFLRTCVEELRRGAPLPTGHDSLISLYQEQLSDNPDKVQ